MEITRQVGANLKQARIDKGLTRTEVATKIKQRPQHYARYERGLFQLNYEQIVILCTVLEITPNDLFGF